MPGRLAVVDVGNAAIHGISFRGKRPSGRFDLPHGAWREANQRIAPADVVAFCSVVPNVDRKLRHPRILEMGRDFPAAIRLKTAPGAETGMDRLAAAVGAWERTKRACLVVDVGSAVTVDVVDPSGAFLGGAIMPGWRLGAGALAAETARLPDVAPSPPKDVIGRSTLPALRAGLHGSVCGLIAHVSGEMEHRFGEPLPVIGTGGGAKLFRDRFDLLAPHLTLEGIRISHERAGG